MLCGSLDGRGIWGRMDTCICMAESLRCSPKTMISVQFSRSVMSPSLQPHGLQQARPPCPSPTPGAYSNSCPLNQWCHPTISSSVIPFSSCPQSFPASGSFQMSQLFTSAVQSIGVSTSVSVLPMNIQDWFPLGLTGWISLQSKGLSRVVAAAAKSLQLCVRHCATPQTAAHQAPLSLGFSRQEHWSGLPFLSPMHESEKWNWSCSVVPDS